MTRAPSWHGSTSRRHSRATRLRPRPWSRSAFDRGPDSPSFETGSGPWRLRYPSGGRSGRARLPIDRVFSLRGIGTVVTGTLWSGSIAVGDAVTLTPSGATARVRSLEHHDTSVDSVEGGGRVAVSLVGVNRSDVARGDTLVTGEPPPRSFRLDVELTGIVAGIRNGERVEILHGTAAVPARVVLFDGEELPAGATMLSQLRLDRAIGALRGDHAVVRLLAPLRTAAAARVLDPAPPRHAGGAQAMMRLAVLSAADAEAVLAALAAEGPTSIETIVRRGLLEPDEARLAVERGVAERRVIALRDDTIVGAPWYDTLAGRVRVALADRARDDALQPGVTPSALIGPTSREALVDRLEADGVLERDGAVIVLPGARASSSAAGARADAVIAALAVAPFAPPRLSAVLAGAGIDPAAARTLVALLERDGRIVRLPDDLALTADAYARARSFVIERCTANRTVTLAELRDETGTSRRYAQAILERLDGDGVTRRVGDARILRRGIT